MVLDVALGAAPVAGADEVLFGIRAIVLDAHTVLGAVAPAARVSIADGRGAIAPGVGSLITADARAVLRTDEDARAIFLFSAALAPKLS
jgi:hypothetical protein